MTQPPQSADFINQWIGDMLRHLRPNGVHFCDGSAGEFQVLEEQMKEQFPLWSLHASLGQPTFVNCSDVDADATLDSVVALLDRAMQGRKMYVVPYRTRATPEDQGRVGMQITDSPFVVAKLRQMTEIGRTPAHATEQLLRGVHSVGTFDPKRAFVARLPRTHTVWSVNSVYSGNPHVGSPNLWLPDSIVGSQVGGIAN